MGQYFGWLQGALVGKARMYKDNAAENPSMS